MQGGVPIEKIYKECSLIITVLIMMNDCQTGPGTSLKKPGTSTGHGAPTPGVR